MKYLPLFEEFATQKSYTNEEKRSFLNGILDCHYELSPYKNYAWESFTFGADRKGWYCKTPWSVQSKESIKDTRTYFAGLGIKIKISANSYHKDNYTIEVKVNEDPGFMDLMEKLKGDAELVKQWIKSKKPLSELDAFLHQKRGTIKGNEFGF